MDEGLKNKYSPKRWVLVKIAACRLVPKTLERHGPF